MTVGYVRGQKQTGEDILTAKMNELVDSVNNAALTSVAKNYSVLEQASDFTGDVYIVGSNLTLPATPVVGTAYALRFDVVKTAAGTVAPVLTVRIGTAGTTSDAAICTFTWGSGTAAADTGVIDVLCVFRTVGAGTSAVLQGQAQLVSNLTTTGLSNAVKALQVTSSGFNSTTGTVVGASWNGGASASHKIELVRASVVI